MKQTIIAAMLALLPLASQAQPIPTIDQVGPKNMPAEVAPIKAPFAMPQLKRPDFGPRKATVKLKKGRMATAYIQKAIDRMAKAGGGTVTIPKGKWQTGRITLKSGVCLNIPEGAELAFSGNIKDYQPEVFTRDEGMEIYSAGAYIYANNAHKIGITGKGIISGAPTSCEIYTANQSNFTMDPEQLIDKTPLEKRHFNGIDTREVFLPKTISPINCTNVLIEGVTLRQCLYWNVVPQYCDSVIIRGVTVESYGHGRTDGMDIESSRNVLVEYCSLDDGDDCFTIKSGRGKDGVRVNRPSENIVIRNSIALRGQGGLVIGSETAGNMKNIYMHDCVFEGTRQAFRFKTRRPRCGGAHGVWVERVRANLIGPAFYCDMLGSVRWAGKMASREAWPLSNLTPNINTFKCKNVIISKCTNLFEAKGLAEQPWRNILIENIEANCNKIGQLQDVQSLVVRDSKITAKDYSATLDGCSGIMFLGVETAKPITWNYSGYTSTPVLEDK